MDLSSSLKFDTLHSLIYIIYLNQKGEKKMAMRRFKKVVFFVSLVSFYLLWSPDVHAVPSFARQTGMECSDCHTIFPELTPIGRTFKLNGYVQSKSDKPYEFPPPISAMAQLSYTNAGGLTDGVAPWDSNNRATDKTNLPQALSLFYGGKIYGNLGAMVQGTYSGPDNHTSLDNTDIRYARKTSLGGKDLVYGITINNNPSVEDLWNTTPAWRFPFASSSVAPTPTASPLIDGGLAQQVGGIGAYTLWNDLIYLEAAVYRTTSNGITEFLGAGTPTDTVVDGAVPYWRVALQKQWNEGSLAIGTYGLVANVFPSGATSGPTDRFTDIAVDAQYQYIRQKYRITLETTWIHEKQEWNASFSQGDTANSSDTLSTFRTNINYYYRSSFGDIGGTVSYFNIWGSSDAILYAPAQQSGSATGSPSSNGFTFEADYVPWKYSKFSLQYVLYNEFNGGHRNYDGFGTNASFNDTVYLLAWFAF